MVAVGCFLLFVFTLFLISVMHDEHNAQCDCLGTLTMIRVIVKVNVTRRYRTKQRSLPMTFGFTEISMSRLLLMSCGSRTHPFLSGLSGCRRWTNGLFWTMCVNCTLLRLGVFLL
jgi:hypothetical protein